MSIQRKYRLNLRNYGNMPAIMVSQYDAGYNLVFEIYDGASPASNLSAYTVTLKGTRCDGLGFTFAGTVASNVLSFLIDNSMTAVSGRGSAEVVITDNNDLIFASFNLPVFVEKAVHPDSTVDADTVQQQTLLEQIQAAASSVTDMTVSSTTLAAGSEATVTKTTVDDVINLEFGLPQGATGATGATPNLTIGTVTTLDPDDDATATITGTAANPVLNLGIPKGDTGEVSQAEFDEVAGDVSQLKSEIAEALKGYTGLQIVPFDATKAHSASDDPITVSVKNGERYFSKIIIDSGENLIGQFRENGTITGYAYTNMEQSHIATADNPSATFYIPKSENGNHGYFIVYTDEYTKQAMFDTVMGNINNFRYTFFEMISGGHSSNADKLTLPIKQGDTYYTYIQVFSGESVPTQSGQFRENGVIVGYAETNVKQTHIATVDNPEISFFIPALSTPSNCFWCAYTSDNASNDINDINVMYADRKRYVAQLDSKPLFLVYADIHGYGSQLNKIEKFYDDTIKSKVFDSILLGDMVRDKYSDDFTFITDSEFGSKTLKVIGNHDVWNDSGIGSLGTLSATDVYNKYIKPNVASWGVTQPANAETLGKCYYYKDYPKVHGGSAMAIRMIVLDEYYWDQTESEWLADVLDDALNNNLSVFVCMHQSVCTTAEAHGLDSRNSFKTIVNSVNLESWDVGYKGSYSSAFVLRRKLIDNFKSQGGKFICYLAGHLHSDFCCYFEETNGKQTQLTLSTAFPWGSLSNNRVSPYASDCFTYFGIDVDLGYLYLVRVGVAEDRNLHSTTVLTYDYINNAVIDFVI